MHICTRQCTRGHARTHAGTTTTHAASTQQPPSQQQGGLGTAQEVGQLRASLQLYNTLHRRKEAFTTRPESPNRVQMYVCGVTVYDYSHIGASRPVHQDTRPARRLVFGAHSCSTWTVRACGVVAPRPRHPRLIPHHQEPLMASNATTPLRRSATLPCYRGKADREAHSQCPPPPPRPTGHARVYVAFDILYRVLALALGYEVQYVRNFTDIDDKIIARAAESGEDPLRLAGRFIEEFREVGQRTLSAYAHGAWVAAAPGWPIHGWGTNASPTHVCRLERRVLGS